MHSERKRNSFLFVITLAKYSFYLPMRKKWFCLFFIAGILINGCETPSSPKITDNGKVDEIAAKINLQSLSGTPIDLATYRGKTVFLNFWATWCKPCVGEMPSLQNAMNLLKNKEIEFLFATEETADEVERFNRQYNFPFNFVRIDGLQQLGIMGLPTTFVFNKEGKLAFSEMGARQWDNTESIELLNKIINQ